MRVFRPNLPPSALVEVLVGLPLCQHGGNLRPMASYGEGFSLSS